MGNVISDCRKKTQRDETFLVLKNGGRRPQAKEYEWPLATGKGKEKDSHLDSSGRNIAPCFSPLRPKSDFHPPPCKVMNLCCFKPLHLLQQW